MVALHRRAGAVGRQLQGREVGELPLPVAKLLVQRFAREPLALPYRIVCVLQRKCRQLRSTARYRRVVQNRELTLE